MNTSRTTPTSFLVKRSKLMKIYSKKSSLTPLIWNQLSQSPSQYPLL